MKKFLNFTNIFSKRLNITRSEIDANNNKTYSAQNLSSTKLSFLMKYRRYSKGTRDTPEKIISIGEEFKQAVKNENPNRALEILGKYDQSTLIKILEYNNNPMKRYKLNLFNIFDNKNNNDKFSKKSEYKKIFTEKELEIIEFIAEEKDKIFDYIRNNPTDKDSLLAKNSFVASFNNSGKRKEGKILYFLLALLIFVLSYDSNKTITCKKINNFFNLKFL